MDASCAPSFFTIILYEPLFYIKLKRECLFWYYLLEEVFRMNDFERKVYRIIFNMTQFGKNPSLDELRRKTGKDEQTIREAVKNLMRQRMLKWNKKKNRWMF